MAHNSRALPPPWRDSGEGRGVRFIDRKIQWRAFKLKIRGATPCKLINSMSIESSNIRA